VTKAKKGGKKKMKAQSSTAQVRATISFPPEVYETLEEIAKQKKYRWRGWSGRLQSSTSHRNGRSSELPVRMSRDETGILHLGGTLRRNRLILGHLNIEAFLTQTRGEVTGRVITDAKDRVYQQTYTWVKQATGSFLFGDLTGRGRVKVGAARIARRRFDSFFGLYSGDGAKGSEVCQHAWAASCRQSRFHKRSRISSVLPWINLETLQREVRFVFSLGEDSAFFMAGEGAAWLNDYYRAEGLRAVRHRGLSRNVGVSLTMRIGAI